MANIPPFGVVSRLTVIVLGATLLFSVPAAASPESDLVEGQRAYENGNNAKSFQLSLKAARGGYAPAYAALGTHYVMGIGTPKDAVKAVFWFRKAAQAGDPLGQYQLAIAYLNGDGVQPDHGAALQWAQASADAGYPKGAGLVQSIKEQLGPNGSTCAAYGFQTASTAFAQCIMQLDQIQQQAWIAQQQYQLQQQQYRQQLAAYQAQQEELRKEKDRRKWAAIGMFGLGMANSASPTFAGGVADGFAAVNSNGATIAAPTPPTPPLPTDFTLRLPGGGRASCSYDPTFQEVRCR